MISVIIPNYNGEGTIGKCLEAVFASACGSFEVVVVDDCSSDRSVDIIRRFPCRLIRMPHQGGASLARNTGARQSRGDILFFIDADCLVRPDTVQRADAAIAAVAARGAREIVGGTYTLKPADDGFFSFFQSVFIHYHETRDCRHPDYIASHAMAMMRSTFLESGGFKEDFLPIIEDVEFSHRLRNAGCTLTMEPTIQVAHIFNFNFPRSMENAYHKARWWTVYSLGMGDLLAESGTASRGLKVNVLLQSLSLAALAAAWLSGSLWLLMAIIPAAAINASMNRGLFRAFFTAGGKIFGAKALMYYLTFYPLAVAAGAMSGIAGVFWKQFGALTRRKWHFLHSGM